MNENPANMIWLWGQGRRPALDSFRQRFGRRGAAICGVDLIRGTARTVGWDIISVPGATGYLDTDYAGKGRAAVEAVDAYDLVFVHIEAPDEAGHNGDVRAKVGAIEQIDKHIVGPLLARLDAGGPYRLMVLCDHPTPVALKTHTADPVPVALCGAGIESVKELPYTEAAAERGAIRIERGYELMEYFLKSGLPT
jgi:2,3-bisphosphoglycerate-independent phosphoglycerate mutase